jgi:hypothetical protein
MEEKRKNRISHGGGSSTPLEKAKDGRKTCASGSASNSFQMRMFFSQVRKIL